MKTAVVAGHMSGMGGVPFEAAYSASKFDVTGFVEAGHPLQLRPGVVLLRREDRRLKERPPDG